MSEIAFSNADAIQSMVPAELSYDGVMKAVSQKKYTAIQATNLTGNQFSVSSTTGQQLEFRLPYDVIYPSECVLTYKKTVAAPGADTYNWVRMDALADWQTAEMTVGSNIPLANISEVNVYSNAVVPLNLGKETVEDVNAYSYFKKNVNANNYDSRQTTPLANNPYGLANSATYDIDGTLQQTQSIKHFDIGAVNTATVRNVRLPMKLFGGAFAIDQPVIGNDNIVIKLKSSIAQRHGLKSSAGTSVADDADFANNAITISNIYLMVPVEENEFIKNSVRDKVMSGSLVVPTDYVVQRSLTLPNSTGITSFFHNVDRTDGAILKRIITIFLDADYLTGGEGNTGFAYDHSNYNGSKVKRYWAKLNGTDPQGDWAYCYEPENTNLAGNELLDVHLMKDVIKSSSYGTNIQFKNGFAIVHDFSQRDNIKGLPYTENCNRTGLDMNKIMNLRYNLNVDTASASLVSMTFFEFSRQAVFSGSAPAYLS